MRLRRCSMLCAALAGGLILVSRACVAQDGRARVDTITEIGAKNTLDRVGTQPFHLLAKVKSPEGMDQGPKREGTIEYWWASPSQWRREIRAAGFHQVLVVNGESRSQMDEGDYFPEWLRELATALVRPVPISATVLRQNISKATVLERTGRVDNGYRDVLQTNVDWDIRPQDATHVKSSTFLVLRSENAFLAASRLSLVSGVGWSGFFEAPKEFHGQSVAGKVSILNPKTTAMVEVLEDLDPGKGEMFAPLAEAEAPPIETVVVSDEEFHEHMHTNSAPVMPRVAADGPGEVTLWADIVTDRAGRIRQMTGPLSDMKIPEVQGYFAGMTVTPFVRNDRPVQAVARVFITFAIPRGPAPK